MQIGQELYVDIVQRKFAVCAVMLHLSMSGTRQKTMFIFQTQKLEMQVHPSKYLSHYYQSHSIYS